MDNDIAIDITPFIEDQLPSFLRSELSKFQDEDRPKIIVFLEAYYEWLQNYRVTIKNDLRVLRDIDRTPEDFLKHFKNELAEAFPVLLREIDLKKFLKKARDFYQAKGSPKSYNFLFYLLFGEEGKVSDSRFLEASSMMEGSESQRKKYGLRIQLDQKPMMGDLLPPSFFIRDLDTNQEVFCEKWITPVAHLENLIDCLVTVPPRDGQEEKSFRSGSQVRFIDPLNKLIGFEDVVVVGGNTSDSIFVGDLLIGETSNAYGLVLSVSNSNSSAGVVSVRTLTNSVPFSVGETFRYGLPPFVPDMGSGGKNKKRIVSIQDDYIRRSTNLESFVGGTILPSLKEVRTIPYTIEEIKENQIIEESIAENNLVDLGSYDLDGGTGYREGEIIVCNSTNWARVDKVSGGQVSVLTINDPGTGYVPYPSKAIRLRISGNGLSFIPLETIVQANLGFSGKVYTREPSNTEITVLVDSYDQRPFLSEPLVGLSSNTSANLVSFLGTEVVGDKVRFHNKRILLSDVSGFFEKGETLTVVGEGGFTQQWKAELVSQESPKELIVKSVVEEGGRSGKGVLFGLSSNSFGTIEAYEDAQIAEPIAWVSSVGPNGEITKLNLVSNGLGIEKIPYVEVVSLTGSNANVTAFGRNIGSVVRTSLVPTRHGTIHPPKGTNQLVPKYFRYDKPIGAFQSDFLFGGMPLDLSEGVARFSVEPDLVNDADTANFDGTFTFLMLRAVERSNHTARARVTFDGIFQYPPSVHHVVVVGNDTNLASDWKTRLFDGYRNQQFSYFVTLERNLAEYENIVKRLIHPAGTKMFGIRTVQVPSVFSSSVIESISVEQVQT